MIVRVRALAAAVGPEHPLSREAVDRAIRASLRDHAGRRGCAAAAPEELLGRHGAAPTLRAVPTWPALAQVTRAATRVSKV